MTAAEYRYLQAIEQIKREKGRAIMSDIAQKLTYARASVYKKLLSMEQQGYIVKDDGKYILVTKKGELEYETLSNFTVKCADILVQHTGLDKKLVMHDAVNMACVLSSRCRKALCGENQN